MIYLANIALILAGGSGTRMHSEIPKQFIEVESKPVIVYTLEAFESNNEIDVIAVVCIKGWEDFLNVCAKAYHISKLKYIFKGGISGHQSIQNGVYELRKHFSPEDIVLVHDAIRPMVSNAIICDCIDKTKKYGSAVAAIPCAEAMLISMDMETSGNSYPRDKLMRTQTPQGFSLQKICQMHRDASKAGIKDSIASCTLMTELGGVVHFSLGSERNIKLTTDEDIAIFKANLLI